ncbi:hypothetical protein L208DRAFT_1414109, partial [Tricholoma matsutake]
GHTLALLSLVGIAERQWSPTLPLTVCVKAGPRKLHQRFVQKILQKWVSNMQIPGACKSILFGRCPPRRASYV